jgi:hypothetical protein
VDRFARRSFWFFAILHLALLSWPIKLAAEVDANGSVGFDGCQVFRMQPTGMLAMCGMKLRALLLTLEDVSRTIRYTPDGLFHFNCPIEAMCDHQPRIDGWLIYKEPWHRSAQDETAIAESLKLQPAVRGPVSRTDDLLPESPKSACGTFPTEIAGMSGLAACYDGGDKGPATIAVIVSGVELGFAILFRQSNTDLQTLREKVIGLAPRFKLERAEGDIQLLKWIK